RFLFGTIESPLPVRKGRHGPPLAQRRPCPDRPLPTALPVRGRWDGTGVPGSITWWAFGGGEGGAPRTRRRSGVPATFRRRSRSRPPSRGLLHGPGGGRRHRGRSTVAGRRLHPRPQPAGRRDRPRPPPDRVGGGIGDRKSTR